MRTVTDGGARVARTGRPTALEWAGWALLALLTGLALLLALFRPTDPSGFVNEIRLAAGFDRYQAAIDEGDRLYAGAVAILKTTGADAIEGREPALLMFEEAAAAYETARREADAFHEDVEAQNRLARVTFAWARTLYQMGDRPWYRRDDEATLRRARAIVDRGLALPQIRGELRVRLEELGTRIDRALTPWPIL